MKINIEDNGIILADMYLARIGYHAKKIGGSFLEKINTYKKDLSEIEIIADRLYRKESVDDNEIKPVLSKIKELISWVNGNEPEEDDRHNFIKDSLNCLIKPYQ